MDEDEEMPATLEDPAADEEETRALVEAFEAEQAAQEAQVRDHSQAIAMHTNPLSPPDQPSVHPPTGTDLRCSSTCPLWLRSWLLRVWGLS